MMLSFYLQLYTNKISAWELVNHLDNFYGGYQLYLIDFSKLSGDKYPMEECNLVGL